MRIHRLELQAIGPFTTRQCVDMDALNDAGLFLLDGPTGAGKSTVLAAVCFALYAQAPGGRRPEGLVSTRTEPGEPRPEVLLECTLGGRRFEIQRWPEHRRRARRARAGSDGLTREKSGVVLRELVDGEWVHRTSRADEAAQLLQGVLPLDADQFMRVVLLPQGEFAAFLRADHTVRADVLRRLFGTRRFDAVEQFLADRAAALEAGVRQDREAAGGAREELLSLLADGLGPRWWATAAEEGQDAASGASSAPDEPEAAADPETEAAPPADDRALASAGAAAARRAQAEAGRAAADAADAATAAEAAAQALHRDAAAHAAAEAWDARRAALDAGREEHEAMRRRLADHGRAAVLDGLVRAAERARAELRERRDALAAAASAAHGPLRESPWAPAGAADAVGALVDGGSDEAAAGAEGPLDGALEAARRRADGLRRAEEDRNRHAALAVERERSAAAVEALAAEAAARDEETGRQRQLRRTAEETAARTEDAARALAEAETALAAAEERVVAARTAAKAAATADRARTKAREREQALVRAREARADVLERFLAQAAARLAQTLEAGTPCAVCGAVEHPHPAEAVADAVTQEDVDAADAAVTEADRARTRADRAAATAEEAHRSAAEDAGEVGEEAAVAARDVAAAALAAAREDRQRVREAAESAAAAARRLEALADEAADAAARRSAAQAAVAEADRRLGELAAAVRSAVGLAEAEGLDAAADRIADGLAGTREVTAALEALRAALAERSRASAVAVRADEDADAALAEAPFDTVDQVRAALLDDDERARLETAVAATEREEAEAAALRTTETVALGLRLRAAGTPAPDEDALAAATEAARRAAEAREAAAADRGAREQLLRGVERQGARLARALDRSAGALEEFETVRGLRDLVRGAGENALSMPLTSYVLSGWLEEVAAAASERLLRMTDGRYALEQTDERATGQRRAGLEIAVRDHHTGTTRRPETLSGGETFMASLALALGLADTVRAEAGALDLDTLFVDEGFGSLDSDTLDEVMEVVDGLRSGGRTVGLVSHVERMRQEIPVRLEVRPDREQGSTLRIVTDL